MYTTPEELRQRRQKLLDGKKSPYIAVVYSGRSPRTSADGAHPFHVDRNFYWLTNIDRSNMILVLKKVGDTVSEELYIEPFDETQAKWVGARMLPKQAAEVSGIETIKFVDDFPAAFHTFIRMMRGSESNTTVGLDLWKHTPDQEDTLAHKLAHQVQRDYPYVAIDDLYRGFVEGRIIKSQAEIDQMLVAQEHTRVAIEAMMKHARPGMNECEMAGAFDFALAKQGITEHAFHTICAGGVRGTTLHYGDNNQNVEDGELVLIDLGSAYQHYCADISRTFPVNGKFTQRQKDFYNVVLAAQDMIIENARPGLTLRDLNDMVVKFYEQELPKLGLLQNGDTVRDYYYHSVSHQLGLDCHDINCPATAVLKPGMVITVEPGLYIEQEAIGIRIENDILITEDKAVDLSKNILKTVEDIEALMADNQ